MKNKGNEKREYRKQKETKKRIQKTEEKRYEIPCQKTTVIKDKNQKNKMK